jgi:hypothetical protein
LTLQAGVPLPATFTFNNRPATNQQLATITFGGAIYVTPTEMDITASDVPNYGGTQAFAIRATADNA